MAIILRTDYLNNIATQSKCAIYVDSINTDSFLSEMYGISIRHIRETLEVSDKTNTSTSLPITVKKENHIAIDENDIYYKKADGFWLIYSDKTNTLTLYKKTTLVGTIYNTVCMPKVLELRYETCGKVVPKVFNTEESQYTKFQNELNNRVTQFRDRASTESK